MFLLPLVLILTAPALADAVPLTAGDHTITLNHDDALAERENFLAVYSNGTGRLSGRLLTWNAALAALTR
jgi:hypothetical protein